MRHKQMTLTTLAAAVLFLAAGAVSASTETVDGFEMGKVTKINVPSPLYDDAMVMVKQAGKKTICKVMMVRANQTEVVKAGDIKPRELSLYGCDEVTTGVAFHSPEQGK